ncbi:hypothetical protein C6A77_21225 [Pseudomonas sp. AFG_SD02_1510_Pfu_092]|nr:hypothetical protein C6A77_21225 [Pseudomonas sp. AFG_SD02_1510_Pfu_092]
MRGAVPFSSCHARTSTPSIGGAFFCLEKARHTRPHRIAQGPQATPILWKPACPRSRRRGGWHRLRRCSRARPLPQSWRQCCKN